jgi:hypothetical protein
MAAVHHCQCQWHLCPCLVHQRQCLGHLCPCDDPCGCTACRYSKGAVCPDDAAALPPPASGARDDPFVPSAAPGSRLPHFDVQLLGGLAGSSSTGGSSSGGLAGGGGSQACSVHDVVSRCGAGSLLLLLGPGVAGSSSSPWQEAASQLRREELVRGVQLHMLQLLPAGAGCSGGGTAAAAGGAGAQGGSGWYQEAVDSEGRWQQLSGVGAGGVLLVRPDGHVAWRVAESSSSGSTAEQLAGLLKQAVGRVLPA